MRQISAKLLRTHQTEAESLLWEELRNRKLLQTKFRRQVKIGVYIVDFISFERRLIVELDGEPHNSTKRKEYDIRRSEFLKNEGFIVLRFWNNDVLKNIDYVLHTISISLDWV